MLGFGALLTLASVPGCRLFGAVQEVTDLLDEPITMQGWYVGVELPPGIDLDGTTLDLGAQAQAWVQKTSLRTSGIISNISQVPNSAFNSIARRSQSQNTKQFC